MKQKMQRNLRTSEIKFLTVMYRKVGIGTQGPKIVKRINNVT